MVFRRRRMPRRVGVAAIATFVTLSTILALSAAAGSVSMSHPRRTTLHRLIDSRAGMTAPASRRSTQRARVVLARRLGSQGVVAVDPMTGTLRMVGRLDGFLTRPSDASAAQVAMGYVRAHLAAFGLVRADLTTFRLRRDYVDILGTHHLSWSQSSHGVTVFQNCPGQDDRGMCP